MEFSRTIYCCTYFFKANLGPVRDSKVFRTEPEAGLYADELKESGYTVVVWRERQVRRESAGQLILTTR